MRQRHVLGMLTATGLGLLLATGQAQAQVSLSIAGGPTFATVSTDEFDTSNRTAYFVAVGTSFALNDMWAIQPFVSYVQKGAKFSSDSGEDIYHYIEIPVFLSVGLPLSESLGLGLSAGPQVSFNVKCNEKVPGLADYDCKEYDDYNGSTDFGIVGSAALQFPVGSSSLSVGGGYDLGLTDVFEGINGGYKNRAFFIFGSYGMSLGGM